MTDEEINRTIAEYLGVLVPEVQRPESLWPDVAIAKAYNRHCVPDYCNDLDAMHEAEKTLIGKLINGFRAEGIYENILDRRFKVSWHAAARQRAETFVRTIGKWRDS